MHTSLLEWLETYPIRGGQLAQLTALLIKGQQHPTAITPATIVPFGSGMMVGQGQTLWVQLLAQLKRWSSHD
tara:strand:- start:530 stop:745 length:216 start_codon:yes stop_codon:yes gene_type:complete